MRLVVVLALLAACGGAQRPECSFRCTVDAECPEAETCSAGFCGADTTTCEPEFESLAVGTGFACALDQFKRSWCWGDNADGQIEGSTQPLEARAIVSGDLRWDALVVGAGHACGLDDDELYCWGKNDRNQVTSLVVGDVTAPSRIEIPGQTARWGAASAGTDYTCGIAGGKLYCWGSGEVGKLGSGGVDDMPLPQLVDSDVDDWTRVATGGRHTCGVSRSVGLFCWGDGSSGQLGNNMIGVERTPQFVPVVGEVVAIAIGLHSTCAVTDDGELYCWGRAADGALGDPALIAPEGGNVPQPTRASSLGGWVEVAAAERYACARRVNGDGKGEVWCWGTASGGGIGNGHWRSARAFAKVLDDADALDVGWNASSQNLTIDEGDVDLTCAVVAGDIACWGDNRTGQLGQGGATHSPFPVEIAGEHDWTTVVAGSAHACGVAGGETFCWGSSERGQVDGTAAGGTNPCTLEICDAGTPVRISDNTMAIAAGAAHTCALRGSAITCWGDNAVGQCGSAPSNPLPPTDVPGTWSDLLGAGPRGACGVSGTETWCWGEALATHEPAHEAPLDAVQTIALGDGFGCALDAAGELACFGSAANVFGNGGAGTCGDAICNANETALTCAGDCGPGPLTQLGRTYTALVAGGRTFVCGLRADGGVECWGDNFYGQVGQVDGDIVVHPVVTPFHLADLAGCTQIAAGTAHACAVCGGSLACWGDASHGELGLPITLDPITTPRIIAPPGSGGPWASVTAGDRFTCAVTTLGKAFCWGTSVHGALGNGSTSSNLPVIVQR